MTEKSEAIRRILVADLGGTYCRFAQFRLDASGGLRLVCGTRLETVLIRSQAELLAALDEADLGLSVGQADAVVFAVPGAVVGRRVRFANIPWELDLDAFDATFGPDRVTCVNDFLAQALGCRTEAAVKAMDVRPGEWRQDCVQAVIGAGTGCGMAALLPLPEGGVLPLPSEGGQTAAKFFDPVEQAFAQYLCRLTGERYVRGDTVLSGSGLAHLHCFLTGEDLDPVAVAARLTANCRTTELFARFYGRAVRDYALTVLATGGIFISGGVAAKNPDLVLHPEFSREFLGSPTYGDLLASIPIRLVRNEHTGLFGAARYAANRLPPLA